MAHQEKMKAINQKFEEEKKCVKILIIKIC